MLRHVRTSTKQLSNVYRAKSSAVILEKNNEGPIVALSSDEVDLIGPPDPVSNLRPIVRKRFLAETKLQENLRLLQESTQQWNHNFWSKHNTRFLKEKQAFIDGHQIVGEEKRQLTAEEMSEFYKKFLDEHWKTHVIYNFEWYKKNFSLLFLAFRVNVEKNIAKVL